MLILRDLVLGLMFLNNNLVLLKILVFLQKMGLSDILIMVKDCK